MVRLIYFLRSKVISKNYDGQLSRFVERVYHATTNKKYALNTRFRKRRLIVSFTTIPARLDTLWIVAESIFRQTYRPDKFILWIAEDEIDRKDLEKKLAREIEKGLEIRVCENLGPHKKYFYAFQEFNRDLVVTIDDDVIYPEDMLERLVMEYVKNPNCVYCHRARKVAFTQQHRLKMYKTWSLQSEGERNVSDYNLATGCGGILYPVHMLPKRMYDADAIYENCLMADDIWLYMHEIYAGIRICKVKGCYGNVLSVNGSQDTALAVANLKGAKNDIYIGNVEKFLGKSCWEMIDNRKRK